MIIACVLIAALGFFLTKKGIIDKTSSKFLASLIIKIFLPAAIFSAFPLESFKEASIAIAIITGVAIVSIVALKVFARKFKFSLADPNIIAFFLGALLYFTHLALPEFINFTISTLASAALPLISLYIGYACAIIIPRWGRSSGVRAGGS